MKESDSKMKAEVLVLGAGRIVEGILNVTRIQLDVMDNASHFKNVSQLQFWKHPKSAARAMMSQLNAQGMKFVLPSLLKVIGIASYYE
ncbi:hypothetical protein KIW84_063225 [Lathyrus oleraceus]|uniref:Uncharacterized protein n=1 Tax=Pisum sativum TaxID=3888 RepID=A0A9D5A4K0_PEA|nr:hypothetical protein KIW84_063225 [Pisum sativum]